MIMVNIRDNLVINKEMVTVHIFGKMEEGIHFITLDMTDNGKITLNMAKE